MNSVDNVYTDFVEGKDIALSVKDLYDRIAGDSRATGTEGRRELSRSAERVQYIEQEFQKYINLIGEFDDGSRYVLLNYYGYDAATDTIKFRSPLTVEMFKREQQAYSLRQSLITDKRDEGKRLVKKDFKPLALNMLFDARAYNENEATLEIAVYITNKMLTAGSGRGKSMELRGSTIIKECERFAACIEAAKQNKAHDPKGTTGTTVTATQRINTELNKIASACKLIMNPKKCSATSHFQNITFYPADSKGHLKAPTSSKLHEKIVITWDRTRQTGSQDSAQKQT